MKAISLLTAALSLLMGVGSFAESSRYEAQDGWRMLETALPQALKGNHEATHDCFMAAYLRASSPFQGGEDCEAVSEGLSQLLEHLSK